MRNKKETPRSPLRARRSAFRIALIGGGNMGEALAAGLLASGRLKPAGIVVTDVRPERRSELKRRYRVAAVADNREAVRGARAIVLCVKPQQMADVLAELRGTVGPRQLVVSIAAGIRIDFIEKGLDGDVPVIRVMPNTPALLRAGALAYCSGRRAKKAHEALAASLLSAAGRVWKVREDQMDAVTALSGSGPAYVFHLAEAMAAAGAKLGLPAGLAEALARRTAYGAGLMLEKSAEPAGELRRKVTSPGGTTEAALRTLEEAGFMTIFERALSAACRRSRELSER